MKKIALISSIILSIGLLIWYMQDKAPTGSPLKGEINMERVFGERPISLKRKHINPMIILGKNSWCQGVEIKASLGTPVYASGDGIIEKIEERKTGLGVNILLKHNDTYSTRYAHLSRLNVINGQVVEQGDLIAYVGETGSVIRPVLYYEVWKNGKQVNPADYLP